MKKKMVWIIVIIVLLIILFFPIKINRLNDGGTVEYKTSLYSITKYHKLDERADDGYIDGIEIKVLGKEIYNNVENIKTSNEKN